MASKGVKFNSKCRIFFSLSSHNYVKEICLNLLERWLSLDQRRFRARSLLDQTCHKQIVSIAGKFTSSFTRLFEMPSPPTRFYSIKIISNSVDQQIWALVTGWKPKKMQSAVGSSFHSRFRSIRIQSIYFFSTSQWLHPTKAISVRSYTDLPWEGVTKWSQTKESGRLNWGLILFIFHSHQVKEDGFQTSK